MKKIISSSLLALTIALSGVITGAAVQAQTTTTTNTPSNQTVRCSIAQSRLSARIESVETAKTTHLATYNELASKLDTIFETAEASGYITTELTSAKADVQAKTKLYEEKATAYSTSLSTTKELACGNSDTEFATALAASRKALTETRTANTEVKTAFKETVIPSLKNYITWFSEETATQNEQEMN